MKWKYIFSNCDDMQRIHYFNPKPMCISILVVHIINENKAK